KIPDIDPFACLPKLERDEEKNLHLFFHREYKKVFTLYHMVSFDKGKSWSRTHTIVETITSLTRGIFFPSVVFLKDNIYLVWQDRQSSDKNEAIDDELYFSLSQDLGQTWSKPDKLTDNTFNDSRPSLILDPFFMKLYLFWESDKEDDWDIYMKKGSIVDEDTIKWEDEDEDKQISDTSANSYFAVPVLKNQDLYIFWYDYRKENSELFYRRLNIPTQKLGKEIQFTVSKDNSKRISLSKISNSLYPVWEEKNDKGIRIYFKQEDNTVLKPIVYSTTHPQNKWVNKRDVRLFARKIIDESGIKGFSYIMDNDPATVPDIINYEYSDYKMEFQNIPDGINFFHLRAVDKNDNWSETTHYSVRIDTSGPNITDLITQPIQGGKNNYDLKFTFKYFDHNPVKGFSYQISKKILTKLPSKIMTKKKSGLIRNLKEGVWFFNVKGVDMLGNWSEPKYFKVILTGDDIAPTPPRITSPTHSPDVMSTNNNPRFHFRSVDNIGIKGYNYKIVKDPQYKLPKQYFSSRTNTLYKKLQDGQWYFMARSVDYNNNWSQPSVFPIQIDHSGPEIKDISCIVQSNLNETADETFTASFKWDMRIDENNVGYSFDLATDRKFSLLERIISPDKEKKYENLTGTNYFFTIMARDQWGNWGSWKRYELDLKKKIRISETITKADMFIYDDILYYRVKRGDSLSTIISIVLLTGNPKLFIPSVIKYNKIINPDLIQRGDYVKFPLLRIKDTIVINKIPDSFIKNIKNKIIKVKRSNDGVILKKERNLSRLWKNHLIIIKLGIFLETGKFYFY
ncbi:MAG: glycoside hydrolase, partial [Spirochaetes bacterium]|nr:glycoside hydrolase [Spirochaetota bacterium]